MTERFPFIMLNVRRCFSTKTTIPLEYVPNIKPKKKGNSPSPLKLLTSLSCGYYSDDENFIRTNDTKQKEILPLNSTKSLPFNHKRKHKNHRIIKRSIIDKMRNMKK